MGPSVHVGADQRADPLPERVAHLGGSVQPDQPSEQVAVGHPLGGEDPPGRQVRQPGLGDVARGEVVPCCSSSASASSAKLRSSSSGIPSMFSARLVAAAAPVPRPARRDVRRAARPAVKYPLSGHSPVAREDLPDAGAGDLLDRLAEQAAGRPAEPGAVHPVAGRRRSAASADRRPRCAWTRGELVRLVRALPGGRAIASARSIRAVRGNVAQLREAGRRHAPPTGGSIEPPAAVQRRRRRRRRRPRRGGLHEFVAAAGPPAAPRSASRPPVGASMTRPPRAQSGAPRRPAPRSAAAKIRSATAAMHAPGCRSMSRRLAAATVVRHSVGTAATPPSAPHDRAGHRRDRVGVAAVVDSRRARRSGSRRR